MKSLKEIKKPKIKPYVCTPAYDGNVTKDYALALADTGMMMAAHGYPMQVGIMGNSAFIEISRNTFVQMFLETDCTHLFFVDADLHWEPRAFLGLLQSGFPVCAGLYRRRQEPEDYPVKYVESPEGGIQLVNGGWIRCERVPTGFLCIERYVIEEMANVAPKWKLHGQPDVPQVFYRDILPDGRFIGEDYKFCDDYREMYGDDIYVWPDFDFVHGGYKCNWHNFIMKQIEAAEKEEKEAADGK